MWYIKQTFPSSRLSQKLRWKCRSCFILGMLVRVLQRTELIGCRHTDIYMGDVSTYGKKFILRNCFMQTWSLAVSRCSGWVGKLETQETWVCSSSPPPKAWKPAPGVVSVWRLAGLRPQRSRCFHLKAARQEELWKLRKYQPFYSLQSFHWLGEVHSHYGELSACLSLPI